MSEGWIKLYREITDHLLWKKKPFSIGQAWIDILLEVNHEDNKVLIKGKIIECKRGESIKSLETWAKRWGWTKSKVRRFFNLLKSDSMIDQKPTQETTHLIICNYDRYQDIRNANETVTKRKRNGDDTKQECKNVRINNNDINIIVEYLNEKAKKQFRTTTKKTATLIKIRLKEGFAIEDFKKVIDLKCQKWLYDEKMNQFLRPETLFGNKFEGYLNEKPKFERDVPR